MRPEGPLQHAKHIVRAGLLLVLGVVALVLGRSLFVPKTWGEFGHYRGANVAEQMDHPVVHGGNQACEECHPDEYEEVTGGVHASLACESCHAPLAAHVADEEMIAEMPVQRSRSLCLNCHEQMDARPATHPQVIWKAHLKDQGVEESDFTDAVCFDCHEAHAPL